MASGYNLACINMYVPPKVRDGTVVPLEAGTTSSMQARGPWNKEVVMDVDCREMEMDLQEDAEGESCLRRWGIFLDESDDMRSVQGAVNAAT